MRASKRPRRRRRPRYPLSVEGAGAPAALRKAPPAVRFLDADKPLWAQDEDPGWFPETGVLAQTSAFCCYGWARGRTPTTLRRPGRVSGFAGGPFSDVASGYNVFQWSRRKCVCVSFLSFSKVFLYFLKLTVYGRLGRAALCRCKSFLHLEFFGLDARRGGV